MHKGHHCYRVVTAESFSQKRKSKDTGQVCSQFRLKFHILCETLQPRGEKKPDSKLQGAIKGKGSSIMAVRQIAALRRCRDGKGAIGGLLSFQERNWSRNRRINSLGCNKATSWLLLLSPFPDESDGENHAADYHWGIESTYMSGAYIDHKSILI